MISILHLFWIVPLSMGIGAAVFLCVCLAFAFFDKQDEQVDRKEIIDAAFSLDF